MTYKCQLFSSYVDSRLADLKMSTPPTLMLILAKTKTVIKSSIILYYKPRQVKLINLNRDHYLSFFLGSKI